MKDNQPIKFYRVFAVVSVVVQAANAKEASNEASEEFQWLETSPTLPFELDSIVESSIKEVNP